MTGRLKLLVWCPYLSPGGGVRLLTQLVRHLAVHPRVEAVRLALNPRGIAAVRPDFTDRPTVSFFSVKLSRFLATFAWRAWMPADSPVWKLLTSPVRNAAADAAARLAAAWEGRWPRRAAHGMDVCYAYWPHLIDPFPAGPIPVVSTFQDATLLHYPEFAGVVHTILEWERMRGWVRRSAEVVVSSEFSDHDFRKLLGRDWPTPAVIPHRALPDHRAGPGTPVPGLPERFVVYPANTSPHKNHANLLTAWSRIPPAERIPLVLFGHGTAALRQATHPPYVAVGADSTGPADHGLRLAALARRLGLEQGRDFFALGYMPDDQVLAVNRQATALVMPSFNEGGGSYPVEEALALGTPVLCSDIPVMREHLARRSAKVAWFDPYSPDAIRAAFAELMRNYPLYKNSTVAGVADPRPGWGDIAEEYVRAFERAAGGNHPGRPS